MSDSTPGDESWVPQASIPNKTANQDGAHLLGGSDDGSIGVRALQWRKFERVVSKLAKSMIEGKMRKSENLQNCT